MEKEDNRRSGASMTEADFAYVRNINTTAGRAGRSIDPAQPGPDAERIAKLERDRAIILKTYGDGPSHKAYKAETIRVIDAELSRLRNEQPKEGDAVIVVGASPNDPCPHCGGYFTDPLPHECAPSPAPSPEPQDVRAALEPFATFGTNPDGDDLTVDLMRDRICDWFGPADFRRAREALAALAQSAAQPEYHPDGRRKGKSRLVYDKEKRTIVPEPSQSDAQPVGWRDAVSNALDAWFASPPNETDLGLERSMDAALKAARAVLATPTSPSAGLIETADEMWKALRPFAFHGECYFDAKDNETFSPTIARNRLTVGKLKAASKAYRAYEALAHAIAADRSAPRSDRGGA